MNQPITADTITDEQIRELRDGMIDDFRVQWAIDALASHDHPQRRRNCRKICADIINARAEFTRVFSPSRDTTVTK